MVDGVEEIVDEEINDSIIKLLNEIYLTDLTLYCYAILPGLYAHQDITFRSILYSLLYGYEDIKNYRLKITISNTIKSDNSIYFQFKEFVTRCITKVLDNSSLVDCICKTIQGDCEELSSTITDVYKYIIRYICNEYESRIAHNEYDKIYEILDEYDKSHENRYPVD